tara:strand:- start:329 stop:643 length:315 start_codon:yes stop_codon:yes gene_type:complete
MDINVSVRYRYGTYTARAGKQRASCTGGERQAVHNLSIKILGEHQRREISRLGNGSVGESEWKIRIDTSQTCKVCGCTWDNACDGGCHWVEPDLCSRCQTKEAA